ncbi:MAG: ATP-binding cassette domain-containing protein [Chitinivibrionales bacterium]|nr:ATP-binding cassette domain-containing protein [Chitinivibrionales bacterium]
MIEFKNVSKHYNADTYGAKDLSFLVKDGEIFVLVGLSGCGKTTTLKLINRLIEADTGDIKINGIDVKEWDPIALRRNIGYVIQDSGLFPHMTIAENVAIIPRLKRWNRKKIDDTVRSMLSKVDLDPEIYGSRYPAQLSGGQKKRAGVARALAGNAEIILMDEPFGGLDPITREELQNEFVKLQKKLSKSVVFVTHDIFEAVKIGNRIAVMHDGRIQQLNYPDLILHNPANKFVENFIGPHRDYLINYAEKLAREKRLVL